MDADNVFGPKVFMSEPRARHTMNAMVEADHDEIDTDQAFDPENWSIKERTIQQSVLDDDGNVIRTDELIRWTIEDEDGRFFKFERGEDDEIIATVTDKPEEDSS